MRWEGQQESSNVEDRRGMAPVVGGGLGIGALIIGAIVYFLTGDPQAAKQIAQQAGAGRGEMKQVGQPPNDRTKHFVATITRFTEVVWEDQFQKIGREYEKPDVVLFSDQVQTNGCGTAPSAVGPFYCPADRKVYLDPSFFDELEQTLGGSKADFSKAYVIAHEVGHHVQNLLGYSDRVRQFEKREGKNGGVRLELQADYLAGVWAHYGQKKFNFIEPGDVEAALTTANAIGDDRIMKNAGRWPSPEKFTHGSSAQRIKFFRQGLETGDFSKRKLDTFFEPSVNPLKL
jgi:predicted metalloprotease